MNILLGVGISTEFCVHVAHSFARSTGTKNDRAFRAIVETFSSVFGGITITKVVGLIVLAFSPSPVIRAYFFQMYLFLLVLGSLHGLVFLPVLLSLFGTDKGAIWLPQKYQHAIGIERPLTL